MAAELAKQDRSGSRVKRRRRRASSIWIGGTDAPSRRPATITFGSVTIRKNKPSPVEFQHNVETGRYALSKVKPKLLRPGVSLRTAKGVPLYHADPEHPDLVIRVLDGNRERGFFEGGKFKPI